MKISGSLVKRGNKWSVSYRVDGKQKTKALGLDVRQTSKSKAKKAMDAMFRQLEEGTYDLYNMPFCEYLEWWLNQIKPMIKDSTFEGYEKNVHGKIKPYFAQYKLKLLDLRPMHFNEFFIYLKERGRANGSGGLRKKSINNIRGVITSALDYAKDNGLLVDNVALQSRLPRFDDEVEFEPIIYTPEQIIKLMTYSTATNNKANLFLHLQVYTACRKGEILGLTWDNVDFDNATIRIIYNRTGSKRDITHKLTTPKSKNSIRILPIPPLVVELLQKEKEHQDKNRLLLKDCYTEYEHDYVIRQADGRIYNPNSINRILKKMMKELDLPYCRPHDFRHFHASILANLGKTAIIDITRQLGHSSTAITEKIYVHSNNTVPDDNLKIIQEILGNV